MGMACSMSSAVVSEALETREYKVADLVGLIHYLLNGSGQQENVMDLNSDGKVNVIDLLWMKSTLLGDIDPNAKVYDVAKLNEAASAIYDCAQYASYFAEMNGIILDDKVYSSDDLEKEIPENQKEFYEKVSAAAKKNNINKWKFVLSDYVVCCAVTGSDDMMSSGTYPNMVPQKYNIPFKNDTLQDYACDKGYDWSKDFKKYVSLSPLQSKLPDYTADVLIRLRNSAAKKLFTRLETLSQDCEMNGMSINGVINSDSSNDFAQEYRDKFKNDHLKWNAYIDNGTVLGVVCMYDSAQYCGTYPNLIPQKYNIPYSTNEHLAYAASDMMYDWSIDYDKYISSDPEQSSLPDYPLEIKLKYERDCAIELFDYINNEIDNNYAYTDKLNNGIINSHSSDEFSNLINETYDNNNYEWAALIEENEVKGVVCRNKKFEYCGTYPNIIPLKYNIPFDSELAYRSSDTSYDWSTDYSKYISTDPKQIELADYSDNNLFLSRNSNAKSLFTYLQTLSQEYEAQGIEIDGVLRSDDPNDTTQKIKNEINQTYGIFDWCALFHENVLDAVICRKKNDQYCGAYPNSIPDIMNVPFSDAEKYLPFAGNVTTDWKKEFPEFITDNDNQKDIIERMEIIQFKINSDKDNISDDLYDTVHSCRRLQIVSSNYSAKSIFTNATTVLQEKETQGNVLPDGIYTSDNTTDDFIIKINQCISLPGDKSKWAVRISSGIVVGAVCSNTGSWCTGAYPNGVPYDKNIEYNHELVINASDINFIW